MDTLTMQAERIASGTLSRVLDVLTPGARIEESEDLRELLGALERYLPEVLRRAYPEAWRCESLDGLYLAGAIKTGVRTAELTGMCILITDQTLTLQVGLRVAATADHIEWVHCRRGPHDDPSQGHKPEHRYYWQRRAAHYERLRAVHDAAGDETKPFNRRQLTEQVTRRPANAEA